MRERVCHASVTRRVASSNNPALTRPSTLLARSNRSSVTLSLCGRSIASPPPPTERMAPDQCLDDLSQVCRVYCSPSPLIPAPDHRLYPLLRCRRAPLEQPLDIVTEDLLLDEGAELEYSPCPDRDFPGGYQLRSELYRQAWTKCLTRIQVLSLWCLLVCIVELLSGSFACDPLSSRVQYSRTNSRSIHECSSGFAVY